MRVAARSWLALGSALLASGFGPLAPRAQELPPIAPLPVRPVVVATTYGPQLAALGEPSACSAGLVAFHATLENRHHALFATSGGQAKTVVEAGNPIRDGVDTWHVELIGARPTVNDSFQVAFSATLAEGGRAVLVARGFEHQLAFVADSGEAFRDFGDTAAINARQHVVFHATEDPPGHPDRVPADGAKPADPVARADPDTLPPPTRMTYDGLQARLEAGLFLDRVGELLPIGRTHGALLDLQDGFAFNDAGMVAYCASRRVRGWSLLRDALEVRGVPTSIAETGERFVSFEVPALNRVGTVAFVAHTRGGSSCVCRSSNHGTLPDVLIDENSGFAALEPGVSIDEGGRVAFVGRRADGRETLWITLRAGDERELLAAGALLDGHEVAHLRIGNRAFIRANRMAVHVTFADAGEAIVLLYLG